MDAEIVKSFPAVCLVELAIEHLSGKAGHRAGSGVNAGISKICRSVGAGHQTSGEIVRNEKPSREGKRNL